MYHLKKQCDTCGGVLAESYPLALCPQCLFGQTLLLHESERSVAAAPPRRFAPRRDFFEKYDLLEQLASGGQGVVWKAWDFELHRFVAMKRLAEHALSNQAAVHRFVAEAQITSQLEHPGILPIFDLGLDPDGRPFYATQLLSGDTLAGVWRQVHASPDRAGQLRRAVELLLRVCEVMGHAHARGVIHRDLKPSNVLVGAFGDVRVVDWGSAHVLESALADFEAAFVPLNSPVVETDRNRTIRGNPASPLATASSGQPITLIFTPPELVAGRLEALGPVTDIYAVGVMLYHLLTDRLPYCEPGGILPDPDVLRQLILRDRPLAVHDCQASASRDLAAICQKAMAREPEARYPTMAALAAELRAFLENRPVQARRPGPFLKLQKWAQRNVAYVLLGGSALLLLSVALSFAHGFKAQRDAARQAGLVRNAELAARNGHWRDALNGWQAAAQAGYADKIYLGLQKAESYTILSEPDKARAELESLARRHDLGTQRGAVWLRLGEHELFDEPTVNQGLQHVRAALTSGLDPADKCFAQGLLADTTPAALDLFHQALQINSFHHGAHRHSLGLEFLLGRHADLQASACFFQAVYPDDPSAAFLEVSELAMQGNLAGARSAMSRLRHPADEVAWHKVEQNLPLLAATARRFDPEVWLPSSLSSMPNLDVAAVSEQPTGTRGADANAPTASRTPFLPCIQNGLLEGRAAIASLMLPFVGNIEEASARIKTAWQHHPEAMVPAFAGIYLETRHPARGPKSVPVLSLQAELFQLAADSPSLIRGLNRTSRYLAAKTQYEWWLTSPTNAARLRQSCADNLRQALADPEVSLPELKAYFELAMKLGVYDLARQFIFQWDRQQHHHPAVLRARLDLEMAEGNLAAAWELVSQLLAESPQDAQAHADRKTIQAGLARLNELIKNDPSQ